MACWLLELVGKADGLHLAGRALGARLEALRALRVGLQVVLLLYQAFEHGIVGLLLDFRMPTRRFLSIAVQISRRAAAVALKHGELR